MSMSRNQPCAVYRYFGILGELIYIGSSVDPDHRWPNGHRLSAEWAQRVASRTDQWYASVDEARVAEIDAILNENPECNKRRINPYVTKRSTTLRLSDIQAEELELVARVDGISVAQAVKTAIEQYIAGQRSDREFQERLGKLLAADRDLAQRLSG